MIENLKKGNWPDAFSRNHPVLSAEDQIRLLESKVVIVGLGGLGGYLSTLLARMGTGHLVLVDGDVYDKSNLNRQLLATANTLGKNKAQVTADYCGLINPEIETTVWDIHFTSENSQEILKGANLVLDGLDHIPTRKVLFKKAMSMGIPFIHGAVAEWTGQTSTFLPKNSFSINDIYQGDKFTEKPPSVLAPTVSVIASIEALEAVRVLCGHTPSNVGKLVLFDGEEISFHKINMRPKE